MATDFSLLAEVFVISSLFLLATGYFLSSKDHVFLGKRFPSILGNKFNIIGWLCLGFFWWTEVEYYILAQDPVNALFCAAALPFFGYLSYHEYQSILWNQKYEPLRWLEELRRSRKHAMDDLKVEIATREPKLIDARGRIPEGTKTPQNVPNREKLETRKESLERDRNRLGNVNMLSLEHYRQEAERFDDIKKHRKQLNDEVRRLDVLEKKISEKKETKFMGVYNNIGESFKTSFKEITGGGEAWLVLENEKSPFEGGVTIKARMPRKKLYPVEALSGGEKSLVSMAFIFAIQGYDPSPFYLLDEPDQNLDGVNTEHIGRAIAVQANVAQFLVVSLHHAALREADNVIGVFMDDNGVSHLHQIRDVETFLTSLPTEAEVSA